MLSCCYACFHGLRVTENFQDLEKAPGSVSRLVEGRSPVTTPPLPCQGVCAPRGSLLCPQASSCPGQAGPPRWPKGVSRPAVLTSVFHSSSNRPGFLPLQ